MRKRPVKQPTSDWIDDAPTELDLPIHCELELVAAPRESKGVKKQEEPTVSVGRLIAEIHDRLRKIHHHIARLTEEQRSVLEHLDFATECNNLQAMATEPQRREPTAAKTGGAGRLNKAPSGRVRSVRSSATRSGTIYVH
jgi:hypothetical protein